jgi:hypothetical protein
LAPIRDTVYLLYFRLAVGSMGKRVPVGVQTVLDDRRRRDVNC